MTTVGSLLATSQLGVLIARLLDLFVILLFGRVILSWFPISPDSPLATIYRVLHQVTEPVLGPVRRILPPMGGLDLSPIIVFVIIWFLQYSIQWASLRYGL